MVVIELIQLCCGLDSMQPHLCFNSGLVVRQLSCMGF